MGRIKYFTEEERKEARREKNKRWRENNRKKEKERKRLLREKYPIESRAKYLINNYNQSDKKYGRGKGDLTAKWIIENIFSKPCAHCGKTGWDIIGCNRLDNSKPHTMDNVEPCCKECNDKLSREDVSKKVFQYTLNGELVNIWSSTNECSRNGYNQSCVASCCRGERRTHKGYKWSFEPL